MKRLQCCRHVSRNKFGNNKKIKKNRNIWPLPSLRRVCRANAKQQVVSQKISSHFCSVYKFRAYDVKEERKKKKVSGLASRGRKLWTLKVFGL